MFNDDVVKQMSKALKGRCCGRLDDCMHSASGECVLNKPKETEMQCHVIMLNDSIQEVVLNATAEQADERRLLLKTKYLRDNDISSFGASMYLFHVQSARVVDMKEGV